MKRIANIMTSLVLALMIVSASAGVSFVRCGHTGTVKLAQLTAMDADNSCGMPLSAGCMQLTVLKLAPSDVAQQPAFDFSPAFQLVALPAPALPDAPRLAVSHLTRRWFVGDFHSPPRAYLRLLRVLLT